MSRWFDLRSSSCATLAYLVALLLTASAPTSRGAIISWDGSASQDFNTGANWIGGVEPGAADLAVISLDTANVTLSDATTRVEGLLLGSGAWLQTSGRSLLVDDRTVLVKNTASSVQLFVESGATANDFDTNFLDIETGAELDMSGGFAQIDRALLNDSASFITGRGIIEMSSTTFGDQFNNQGSIIVDGGTLTLRRSLNGVATFNLDGTTETGTVTVTAANAALVVDGPLPVTDSFSTTLAVGDGNTVTFVDGWRLASTGVTNLTGGAGGNATIAGGLAVIDGQVNVTGTTSQFTAPVRFSSTADVNISGGANLILSAATTYGGGSYSGLGTLTQLGDATVTSSTTIAVTTYNWDGLLPGGSDTTVAAGRTLTLSVTNIDSGNDTFNGTINLNGGDASVNVSDNSWEMDGTLNLTADGANIPELKGEAVVISGSVNVTGAGEIDAPATFTSVANVQVPLVTDVLTLGTTTFQGGSYTGLGEINQNGPATVQENTTISVGTYNWDGGGAAATTVNASRMLTLNVGNLDAGNDNYGGTLNLNGGDVLVNVADNAWAMDGTINFMAVGANIPEVNGDSIRSLSGTVNVTGEGRFNVPVTFALSPTVHVPNAADDLFLNGATTFSGGTYLGLGSIQQNGDATVNADTTIQVASYDWDGQNAVNTTTVLGGATWNLNVNSIDDDPGSSFDAVAQIQNSSRINVNTPAPWLLDGQLILNGANAVLGGADLEIETNGFLRGTGSVVVDVTNAGTIAPGIVAGDETGALLIVGTLLQTPAGQANFQFGGTALADYDRVTITGAAKLAGEAGVALVGGFTPTPLDLFTVMTFGSRVGKFTDVLGTSLGPALVLSPSYTATEFRLLALIRGDMNADGALDNEDINAFVQALIDPGGFSAAFPLVDPDHVGDFTGDVLFDNEDIDGFVTALIGGSAAAVPEPSTWLLAVLASAGLAVARRRRR